MKLRQVLLVMALAGAGAFIGAAVREQVANAIPDSQQATFLRNVHSSGPLTKTLASASQDGCQNITMAVPYAAVGDSVALAVPTTNSVMALTMTPSASANLVTVRICAPSAAYGGSTLAGWGATTFRIATGQ